MRDKIICIHFHIFKNAGSTIDWILQKNFQEDAAFIDDHSNPGNRISMAVVLDYLSEHPNMRSVSSHQLRFPIVEHSDFHFLPMIFIRHPIDRAFSIYSFKKKEPDNSLGTIKAKELDLHEYVKWNLETKGFTPMKNFQVLFLSDKDTKSDVDDSDLDIAIKRLGSCPILGVVDRLDESLVLAEEILRPYFSSIDLSYIKQNVSADRPGTLDEKIKYGRSQIGDALMKQLKARNSLDLQLYRHANGLLNARLKNVDEFQKKLTDFRDRCIQLATTVPSTTSTPIQT